MRSDRTDRHGTQTCDRQNGISSLGVLQVSPHVTRQISAEEKAIAATRTFDLVISRGMHRLDCAGRAEPVLALAHLGESRSPGNCCAQLALSLARSLGRRYLRQPARSAMRTLSYIVETNADRNRYQTQPRNVDNRKLKYCLNALAICICIPIAGSPRVRKIGHGLCEGNGARISSTTGDVCRYK